MPRPVLAEVAGCCVVTLLAGCRLYIIALLSGQLVAMLTVLPGCVAGSWSSSVLLPARVHDLAQVLHPVGAQQLDQLQHLVVSVPLAEHVPADGQGAAAQHKHCQKHGLATR
jgi:hypothetical protein